MAQIQNRLNITLVNVSEVNILERNLTTYKAYYNLFYPNRYF